MGKDPSEPRTWGHPWGAYPPRARAGAADRGAGTRLRSAYRLVTECRRGVYAGARDAYMA
ncbi:hypothetical protein GCM10009864_69380 [Streptomyces lunalinharesii]|uniref:Uncharacterized protein n=1 Tax=Streptomyces lunalinharesii TaxID=333384 RepID=A0ABN3SU61_9ACTN